MDAPAVPERRRGTRIMSSAPIAFRHCGGTRAVPAATEMRVGGRRRAASHTACRRVDGAGLGCASLRRFDAVHGPAAASMAEREREPRADRVDLEGRGRTDLDRVGSGLTTDGRDIRDGEDALAPSDLAGAAGQPISADLDANGFYAGDRHVDGSFALGVVVSRGTGGTERVFEYLRL
jgi:hypothetical protein